MYIKTVNYEDFNSEKITEDLYFNLSEREVVQYNLSVAGGFQEKLKVIANKRDIPELSKIFIEFIKMSYGVKSDDGKHFIKNETVLNEFLNSAAYDAFYMELLNDHEEAMKFLKGIFPNKYREAANNVDLKELGVSDSIIEEIKDSVQ